MDYTKERWYSSFTTNLLLLLIFFELCGIITWSGVVRIWIVLGYLLIILYVKILEYK